MREAVGIVTHVQESRFKLVDEAGQTWLFVLSHSAPLEPQDLTAIAARGDRVTVKYDRWEGRIAAVAKDIHDSRRTDGRASGSTAAAAE